MKTFKLAVLSAVMVICLVPVLAFADAAQQGNTSNIDQQGAGDIAVVLQNSAVSDSIISQAGDSGVAIVAQDENQQVTSQQTPSQATALASRPCQFSKKSEALRLCREITMGDRNNSVPHFLN